MYLVYFNKETSLELIISVAFYKKTRDFVIVLKQKAMGEVFRLEQIIADLKDEMDSIRSSCAQITKNFKEEVASLRTSNGDLSKNLKEEQDITKSLKEEVADLQTSKASTLSLQEEVASLRSFGAQISQAFDFLRADFSKQGIQESLYNTLLINFKYYERAQMVQLSILMSKQR
jgi:hypothetical protein